MSVFVGLFSDALCRLCSVGGRLMSTDIEQRWHDIDRGKQITNRLTYHGDVFPPPVPPGIEP